MSIVRPAARGESVPFANALSENQIRLVSEDIADRIPVPLSDKLRGFRDLKNDRHAAVRIASEKRTAVREQLQQHEARLQRLRRDHGDRLTDNDLSIAQVTADIEKAKAELARLTERIEHLTISWNSAARLVTGVELYLTSAEAGGFRLHDGEPAQLEASENAIDALDRAGGRTRALKADRKEILAKAFPVSVATKAAHAWLDQLIEGARPDVSPLIDRLEPIEFPQKRLMTQGGSVGFVNITDPVGLLAWLFPKQFAAALERDIAAGGDDANAMPAEQRVVKLKEIDADIIASEREEAHFAELAGLLPREDLDPRAALGLADDMPAPRKRD